MHEEILSSAQRRLLPMLSVFFKQFGLVGGTAIALHIGHRRSIDFDLFTNKTFANSTLRNRIKTKASIEAVLFDEKDQYSVVVHGVRITFLYYPFPIKFSARFNRGVGLPSLLTLAAMKAYALGRRAKWKDYVDLFFMMNSFYSIDRVVRKARSIFKEEFNEKIFRTQLAYVKDIDYSERVNFMPNHEVKKTEILKGLEKISLS